MMPLRILACCALCCFAFMLPSHAQVKDSIPDKTLTIKFSPQHLLINGYHLYFEKIIKPGGRHGIVFSPRVYAGETRTVGTFAGHNWEDRQSSSVFGYGAEVQHRIYTSKHTGLLHRRAYLAYGLNFHHFNVEFDREGWVRDISPEGLEIYKYRLRPFNEKINRLGGLAILGWQAPLFNNTVLFDFYSGAGYKHSYTNTDYTYARFNRNAFDYGYSGFYFIGGITVGIALR